MASTRTSGISVDKDGNRTLNKVVKGERIFLRLGKVSQEDAEKRLSDEVRERSIQQRHRKNPRYVFADCAKRYLIESQAKRSAEVLAWHIQLLLPFIGAMDIGHVHDATLEEFKESRRLDGVSATTINRSLEVVRTILNRAARAWRDDNGQPWLHTAPPLITMEQENRRPPYPLSWEEQDVLFPELPAHLQTMALFDVNTGLRDENVCGLRWAWETPIPEVGRSVFIIPADDYKTGVDHVAILNDAAWRIVESQRSSRNKRLAEKGLTEYIKVPGKDTEFDFVFTYDGHRVGTMNNSAWDKARIRAAMKMYESTGKNIPKELLIDGQRGTLLTDALKAFVATAMPGFHNVRIHDLRHTYASRLRLAGVPQEDRNALLGHKSASIPEHYASADIGRLIKLANQVLDRQGTRTLLRVVNG
jgi:integrase